MTSPPIATAPGHAFVLGHAAARRGWLVEATPFLAVAVAAHLAAFAIAKPGSSARGGEGGDAAISVEGASPAMAAMVAEWEAAPRSAAPPDASAPPGAADTLPDTPAPEAASTRLPDLNPPPQPQPDSAPPPVDSPSPLPALPALPDMPAAAELPADTLSAPEPAQGQADAPALAPLAPPAADAPARAIDSAPPPPAVAASGELAPERSPRPAARPERPAAPAAEADEAAEAAAEPDSPPQDQAQQAQPPSSAAPTARAADSGEQTQEGREGHSETTSRAGADSAALLAQWGGQIRAAVQRQQRHPASGRMGGTVQLRLDVHSDGRLASVQLVQSSGHAALDRAAVEAARRARLPGAPRGVGAGTYSFNLPVRFQG